MIQSQGTDKAVQAQHSTDTARELLAALLFCFIFVSLSVFLFFRAFFV
eukprot:SAG11_NODE_33396_length_277_cov_1.258427_1_plen_47_part_10